VIPVGLAVTILEAAMMGRQGGNQASLFREFEIWSVMPFDWITSRSSRCL
jgi:hypothetical protein